MEKGNGIRRQRTKERAKEDREYKKGHKKMENIIYSLSSYSISSFHVSSVVQSPASLFSYSSSLNDLWFICQSCITRSAPASEFLRDLNPISFINPLLLACDRTPGGRLDSPEFLTDSLTPDDSIMTNRSVLG